MISVIDMGSSLHDDRGVRLTAFMNYLKVHSNINAKSTTELNITDTCRFVDNQMHFHSEKQRPNVSEHCENKGRNQFMGCIHDSQLFKIMNKIYDANNKWLVVS